MRSTRLCLFVRKSTNGLSRECWLAILPLLRLTIILTLMQRISWKLTVVDRTICLSRSLCPIYYRLLCLVLIHRLTRRVCLAVVLPAIVSERKIWISICKRCLGLMRWYLPIVLRNALLLRYVGDGSTYNRGVPRLTY